MTEPVTEDRNTHFADARSWALDRTEAMTKWARSGWIVAAVATTVAVLEAFAIMLMIPLQTIVPYTVLVDRTTGYSQTLEGLHPQTIKPQAALTQSLLAQYVVARESYDINSIKDQYHRVGLWSASDARREYLALIPATNPESPINIYRRLAVLEAKVSSVDSPTPGKAKVRFVTDLRNTPDAPPERTWWVAEIDFKFTAEPMEAADRLQNPLGFAVTSYRRFQETPPTMPATFLNGRSVGSDTVDSTESESEITSSQWSRNLPDEPL